MGTQGTISVSDSVAFTPEEAPPAPRFMQLDLIRAVAIFLVIGRHINDFVEPAGFAVPIALFWNKWGYFGVPLFFALSGYLVGGLLICEYARNRKLDVPRFLVRRSLKIYPAYFVFLVYLIVMPTLKGTVPLHTLLSEFWENFIFIQNYVGSNPEGHTWSLAVEEHFYLALPFIILAFVRFRLMAWIVPVFLLSPLIGTVLRMISVTAGDPYIRNAPETMAATHLCFDGLLIGVGVRALKEFHPEIFARFRVWRWPMMFLGAAVLASSELTMPVFMGVAMVDRILPLSTIAATAFLIGMLHMYPHDPCSRIAAKIGKFSYGIYLWHTTLLGFAARIVVTRLPGEGHGVHWMIAALICTTAAVLFGIFMSQLVEWPVLALRDRLFPSRSNYGP